MLMPFHNQAAALTGIVDGWLRFLDKLNRPYQLILIDDASTDGGGVPTSRSSHLLALRHEQRRGTGAALRTGLAAAGHPLILMTGCDYPYSPADARKLLEAIDSADIVCGCRTDPAPAIVRTLGGWYRGAARVLFGLPLEPRPGWPGWSAWWTSARDRWKYGVRVHDSYCAFKLIRRTVLERIVLQSDGEFAQVELLAKVNFLGALIAEVSIGKLGGHFKGTPRGPESEVADRRRVFRRPEFVRPPAAIHEPCVAADSARQG